MEKGGGKREKRKGRESGECREGKGKEGKRKRGEKQRKVEM